jgi:hypothetical protein
MTRYIVLSCVLALATWPVHAAEELRSFDRNRDGRIDQWEYFAAGSQEPYKVERDTNGDGKADAVREMSPHNQVVLAVFRLRGRVETD